jgi:hypothetical protein
LLLFSRSANLTAFVVPFHPTLGIRACVFGHSWVSHIPSLLVGESQPKLGLAGPLVGGKLSSRHRKCSLGEELDCHDNLTWFG